MRDVSLTDQAPVLELVEKFQSLPARQKLEAEFKELIGSEGFFKVVLNSNGIVIGVFQGTKDSFEILAVNPNFLKREVKETIFSEIAEWATQKQIPKIKLASKLIIGKWKTYVKQFSGYKMEESREGAYLVLSSVGSN